MLIALEILLIVNQLVLSCHFLAKQVLYHCCYAKAEYCAMVQTTVEILCLGLWRPESLLEVKHLRDQLVMVAVTNNCWVTINFLRHNFKLSFRGSIKDWLLYEASVNFISYSLYCDIKSTHEIAHNSIFHEFKERVNKIFKLAPFDGHFLFTFYAFLP